jgi:two-component system osmolarity sensor histidine kinase EnvZ
MGKMIQKLRRRFLPTSLFGRFLLIILLPALLVQMIATVIFYDRHWETISNRLAESVAREVAYLYQIDDTERAEETLKLSAMNRPAPDHFDSNPSPWQSTANRYLTDQLNALLDSPFRVRETIRDEQIAIDILRKDNSRMLTVMVPQRRLFSSTGLIFLGWLAGSSILLFAVAVLFMRGQIRPIHRLAAAASRFGKGRPVTHFQPKGADEIRQAGDAFITMRDRIQRMMDQRTAMLSGVSHDLRTMLTRLKLTVSMMDDSNDKTGLAQDIQDMQAVLQSYLTFAKGAGQADEDIKTVNIPDWIDNLVDDITDAEVQIDLPAKLSAPMRPNMMGRAIMNLLINAERHADHIGITGHGRRDEVILEIIDDGPGIPTDQVEAMFHPFSRGDDARNLDDGGVGLGLTIARDIIRQHGGTIKLSQSEQLGGLKVAITLPK